LTIVVGSSWPKDELLLVPYINSSENMKFIIAPHNIKTEQIQSLKKIFLRKQSYFPRLILPLPIQ
jgi:3-deoxy-D-manno-octulosonic-acid transferase